MVEISCNSKNLTSYHCACARDLHGNVMYVIRTPKSVYISLFLYMSPPPPPPPVTKPKMSFGQRNVATYIHNICKWQLGSRGRGGGRRVVDAKEDNIQLKTLTSGGKYSVSKYTEASTVISSHLSPLTLEVVGAPQMTLQQYLSILPCLPLPSGNLQTPFPSIP